LFHLPARIFRLLSGFLIADLKQASVSVESDPLIGKTNPELERISGLQKLMLLVVAVGVF
jgi:hypothetical protein